MIHTAIRVLIADDHTIVRRGIRALLSTEYDMEVVGETSDGVETVAQAKVLHPDVILMDLVMPRMNGIEATHQIIESQPGVRILVLTSFAADDKVFPAIKAGAMGYLLKDSSPEELIQAIRQVHCGESSLHPSIAFKVLRELAHPPGHLPASEALTDREMEVLLLVAQGLSNQEIATLLHVTEATIRKHVSNILSKLHLASRTQAALYALREGLASLDGQTAKT